MYMTWASFNNIRMLLMACIPVVIFYLIWLINTSEHIRSEEGTLLDLVCWPDGNVIPVIIACGSIIAVVIQVFGLYQLFKAGMSKRKYNVTNGLFYYVVSLIVMSVIFLAIMFYSGLQSTIIRAKIKDGISKAMRRYSSHLPSKIAMDKLQTKFHCCGRDNYNEWFYIPWYDSIRSQEQNNFTFASNIFVADNVPYSCCSRDVMWPCIHHGVLKAGAIYKYKQLTIWTAGCEEKLIGEMMAVSWRFIAVMALIIVAMILQVIAVRYLHTAYRNGLNIDNQIVSEAYLLRSIMDLNMNLTDSTRPTFRRRFLRKSRTTEWVTSNKLRTSRKRLILSSDSDRSSSEFLLKPISE